MSWPKATDYHEAIQSLRFTIGDEELRSGELALNRRGLPLLWSGNFADVYKVHCPASGNTWAVKCFTREVPGLHDRYREISAHLEQARLPFMVEFRYLDEGIRCGRQWYPILKMRWVEGTGLNQFVAQYQHRPGTLKQLQQLWVKLAGRLREARLAHGDLQHGNVLLVPVPGSEQLGLRLIDYDGMYVPSLAGRRSGEVGHPAYQHPQRAREGIYSGEVDRFSHLVIYTAVQCLLASPQELWARFDNGDNLLFRDADFQRPGESALLRALWGMRDEQARAMVGRLALACHQPLEETPWLDQVVDNGRVLALTPAEQRAADALLAEQRASTVVPALPPGEGWREGTRPVWLDEAIAAPRAATSGTVPAATEGTVGETVGVMHAKSRFGRILVFGAIIAVAALLIATLVHMNAQHQKALAEIETTAQARHAAEEAQLAAAEKARQATLAQEETDRKKARDETASELPPRQTVVDLGNGVKLEMVLIPAGSFRMGDSRGEKKEQPVHHANITSPFYLGRYEVTQEQWVTVMGFNPSRFRTMKNPVEQVSWNDCQAFLDKLNALKDLQGGRFVLPTEAQWEYACRAGSTTSYCFGDDVRELDDYAWHESNASMQTHGVGEKRPNTWGLHDMHGNVWEWCADWYDARYYEQSTRDDPRGPLEGSDRIRRGGGWSYAAQICRSAMRGRDAPEHRGNSLGFRVAQVPAD